MRYLSVILLCATSVWCSPLEKVPGYYQNSVSRIYNGARAEEGQFPWQVIVQGVKPYGRIWCGGALISTKWVLTAGHCVRGAANLTASLGSHTFFGKNPYRVRFNISRYFHHENFNPRNLANDVALLALPESVKFNANIQPIPLSSSNLKPGTTVTVSGFGITKDNGRGPSPYLNYVKLVTIPDNQCREVYGRLTNGAVCAHKRGKEIQSTCQGDSGGPLVAYTSSGPVHVGVVSFGHTDGCASGKPVAFARTHYFRNWIFDKTGV